MRYAKMLVLVLLVCVVLGLSGCVPEAPYRNPPSMFRESDVVGTWMERYGRSEDTLILRPDGTFKQIYKDGAIASYIFETPWEKWWLERFEDGRLRLHLHGARYYARGIGWVERQDGLGSPCPADYLACHASVTPQPVGVWDPVADESVRTVGELILDVQTTWFGETVLIQMNRSSDEGSIIISEGFRAGERFQRASRP